MATIIIKQKREKTFKDISIQCERIFTLHINGYGTDKMYNMVEEIFFNVIEKNGGY